MGLEYVPAPEFWHTIHQWGFTKEDLVQHEHNTKDHQVASFFRNGLIYGEIIRDRGQPTCHYLRLDLTP